MKPIHMICFCVFVMSSCAPSTSDDGGQTGDEARPGEGGSESSENGAGLAMVGPTAGTSDPSQLSQDDADTLGGAGDGTADAMDDSVDSSSGPTETDDIDCPNSVFLDVDAYQGPGDAHPAPNGRQGGPLLHTDVQIVHGSRLAGEESCLLPCQRLHLASVGDG